MSCVYSSCLKLVLHLICPFTVSPEVESSFVTIIDSILAASDLNTISEKRIRKGLQAAVEYDITPQKVCILVAYEGCTQSTHR